MFVDLSFCLGSSLSLLHSICHFIWANYRQFLFLSVSSFFWYYYYTYIASLKIWSLNIYCLSYLQFFFSLHFNIWMLALSPHIHSIFIYQSRLVMCPSKTFFISFSVFFFFNLYIIFWLCLMISIYFS